MTPKAIMIFAAGLGTRMGALTRTRPKPLIPVCGRPLIDHALAHSEGMSLRRVANLHYLGDQIRAHLKGRDIAISDETDALLETGGGLRHALPLLGDGPVFTLNTDTIFTGPNPLRTLAANWDPDVMDALLLLIDRDRSAGHSGNGDFIVAPDGRLARGPGAIYSGAQIIKTELLAAIPETNFSLNRLWDRMIESETAFGIIHPGGWCDVGQPESIEIAERLLEAHHV